MAIPYINRNNFGSLLEPVLKKVFFDTYNEFPEQYSKVFKVEKSQKAEETIKHVGSFGLWSENSEGNPINQDKLEEGLEVKFPHKRFDKGYEISWEMLQDDQYGIFGNKSNIGRIGKNGSAKTLGRSLRATVETEAAKVLDNAFTNIGYDGVSLFSDAHPLTASDELGCNKLTGALDDASLKEAITLLRRQKDEAGAAPIAAIAKSLIVPPDLEFTAKALVNSTLQAGTNNNDINTVPDLSVIVLDYLSNGEQWFVQAKDIENLMFFWREAPVFEGEKLEKRMDWFFSGYARWACGYADWRGIVGSTGK